MIEFTFNYYSLSELWQHLTLRFKRKPEAVTQEEVLPPPLWTPRTQLEKTVFAALYLAGEPVNNRRLAELMGCLPGELSLRVAQLEGDIRKARKGREVLISLN